MITGKARTGQKPETGVSQSLLAALETRKEWRSTQCKGTLTQTQILLEQPQSRASRDEVSLFQRQPRAVCLPWRMRYFFCTQCTFRVGGGSPGLSLPFGRHHTIVLCRPEALRCTHTLQSFIEASYVGWGETNWPGVFLHRTV